MDILKKILIPQVYLPIIYIIVGFICYRIVKRIMTTIFNNVFTNVLSIFASVAISDKKPKVVLMYSMTDSRIIIPPAIPTSTAISARCSRITNTLIPAIIPTIAILKISMSKHCK